MSRAVYMGDIVFHCEDEDGVIDVVDEATGKLRSLQFGTTARQSTMFLERPDELALEYTRCLMTVLPLMERAPRRALMLGLGGGSLVKFLLRWCPDCHVDVVELRPRIVEVAQRFFALPAEHARLQVHVIDGRRFLLGHRGAPYDLILVDLHCSRGMSPVVSEPDFLPACRSCTAADGVMSANLWYGVDEVQERRVRRSIEEAYDQVLYLPVAGKRNCIAHGMPGAGLPTRRQLKKRAASWRERADLPLPELIPELIRQNSLL